MKKMISIVVLLSAAIGVFAQDESDFYMEPDPYAFAKNLVTDYGVNNQDTKDDTLGLQKAIDDVSAQGGGTISIPAGRYYFLGVSIKSNVHIEIAENTVIIPTPQGKDSISNMISAGENGATVKNVSINGLGKGFIVDLRETDYRALRIFQLFNVDNFLLANFTVLDKQTGKSSITFNPTELNGQYYAPRNGVVKNVRVYDAHYGYGLSQIKGGVNVLFKNLSGQGGVTLRLETGSEGVNDKLLIGLMDNLYGRNIFCEDGNAAVMISPHSREIGKADIRGVYAKNCGFAVRVEKGFAAQKDIPGVVPGTFAPSVVEDVTAVYGPTAQLKSKHFKYIPTDLRHLIKRVPNKAGKKAIYIGPSAAAAVNSAEGDGPGHYKVTLRNVEAIGFEYQPKAIVTEADAIKAVRDL